MTILRIDNNMIYRKMVFIMAVLLLTGCQSAPTTYPQLAKSETTTIEKTQQKETDVSLKGLKQVEIFDINNHLLASMQSPMQLLMFLKTWSSRKQVNFIQRPNFQYRIVLKNNKLTQTWLYEIHGALKQEKSKQAVYWLLADRSQIDELITRDR